MEPPLKKAKKAPPPPPNMMLSSLSICRDCNLVFVNTHALNCHYDTEHHRMAHSGMRPPQGSYYCFLCWQGYRNMDDLRTHYNREIHEANALSHRVKAIWMSQSDDPDAQVLVKDRSLSTSPLSLSSTTEEEVDHGPHHCVPCNLVFLSALYLSRHLSCKAHESVIAKIVDKKNFNCFLCGKYYLVKEDLRCHIQSNLHKSFMKSNGVTDFIKNSTELSDKAVTDFVTVDEVVEDVLEEISSEEEDTENPPNPSNLSNPTNPTNLTNLDNENLVNPQELEVVDSPENDFNEEEIEPIILPQPVRTSDPLVGTSDLEQKSDPQPVFQQDLEDIHSDEDEIPISDSEPEQVPDPNAGNVVQNDNLEEIHSDEEIDELENSEPVINPELLESVSSPESPDPKSPDPKSPESKSSDLNDLAFVDTIEFIYD